MPYTLQPVFNHGKNAFQNPNWAWLSLAGRLRSGIFAWGCSSGVANDPSPAGPLLSRAKDIHAGPENFSHGRPMGPSFAIRRCNRWRRL